MSAPPFLLFLPPLRLRAPPELRLGGTPRPGVGVPPDGVWGRSIMLDPLVPRGPPRVLPFDTGAPFGFRATPAHPGAGSAAGGAWPARVRHGTAPGGSPVAGEPKGAPLSKETRPSERGTSECSVEERRQGLIAPGGEPAAIRQRAAPNSGRQLRGGLPPRSDPNPSARTPTPGSPHAPTRPPPRAPPPPGHPHPPGIPAPTRRPRLPGARGASAHPGGGAPAPFAEAKKMSEGRGRIRTWQRTHRRRRTTAPA